MKTDSETILRQATTGLSLIQGLILLHRPSQRLFSQRVPFEVSSLVVVPLNAKSNHINEDAVIPPRSHPPCSNVISIVLSTKGNDLATDVNACDSNIEE